MTKHKIEKQRKRKSIIQKLHNVFTQNTNMLTHFHKRITFKNEIVFAK